MPSYVLLTGPDAKTIPTGLPAKATTKGPIRFRIERGTNEVAAKGTTIVDLPFQRDAGNNTGQVSIDVRLFRHKALLGVVAYDGIGVAGLRNAAKFAREKICVELNEWAQTQDWRPNWAPVALHNSQFDPRFWGNDITAKSAYKSTDRLYLRVASQNILALEKRTPFIREVFDEGVVRWIKGTSKGLDHISGDRVIPGKYVITRDGILKTDFSSIETVAAFYKKLVTDGFFGGNIS